MSEDTITTVGRHLAHWRPSAEADAERARIVAWLRREYRKLAKDKDFTGALALQEAAIAIERREHEETAGG